MKNLLPILKRLRLDYKPTNSDEVIMDCVDPECPNPTNHLYFNTRTGLWICHRCGVTGNLVVLVSIVRKTTAREAQRLMEEEMPDVPVIEDIKEHLKSVEGFHYELQNTLGMKILIQPPPTSKLISESAFPVFLKDRQVPFGLAFRAGIRVCNGGKYNGRLIFPFRCDGNRSFVAYSATGQKPKTLNPPGGMNDRMIYWYDRMNTQGPEEFENRPLVVVEGIFDCLRVLGRGYPSVALLGSFLSRNQALLLSECRFPEITFMLDGDVGESGFKRHLKNMKFIEGKVLSVAVIQEEDQDPDSIPDDEFLRLMGARRTVTDLYSTRSKLKGIMTE